VSKPLALTEEVERVARECNPTVAWAEVDALRAALAAAEAKLETYDEQHAATIRQLMADVADERKHAGIANDILTRLRNASYEFHNEGNHECVDAWLDLYAARRNAEKEDSNG